MIAKLFVSRILKSTMLNWHFLVVLLSFSSVFWLLFCCCACVCFSLNNIFPSVSSYLCVVFFFSFFYLLLGFLSIILARSSVCVFIHSTLSIFRSTFWPFSWRRDGKEEEVGSKRVCEHREECERELRGDKKFNVIPSEYDWVRVRYSMCVLLNILYYFDIVAHNMVTV